MTDGKAKGYSSERQDHGLLAVAALQLAEARRQLQRGALRDEGRKRTGDRRLGLLGRRKVAVPAGGRVLGRDGR